MATREQRLRELINSGLSVLAAEAVLASSNVAADADELADGLDVVITGGSGDYGRTAGASITLKGGGSDGVNEIQTITESGTISGGTWDLTIPDASVVLTDIPYDITAAALEALIGSDDIVVTGGPVATAPFEVEYVGTLARGDRTILVVDGTNLTGSTPDVVAGTDTAGSAGTDGGIILTGLPTADPGVVGQLWSDGGVLTISAG